MLKMIATLMTLRLYRLGKTNIVTATLGYYVSGHVVGDGASHDTGIDHDRILIVWQ